MEIKVINKNNKYYKYNIYSSVKIVKICVISPLGQGEESSSRSYSSSLRSSTRASALYESDDTLSSIRRSSRSAITGGDEIRSSRRSSHGISMDDDGDTISSASRRLSTSNNYVAILDYKPTRSSIDEIALKEGQEVEVLSKEKPHK